MQIYSTFAQLAITGFYLEHQMAGLCFQASRHLETQALMQIERLPKDITLQHPDDGICCGRDSCRTWAIVEQGHLAKDVTPFFDIDTHVDPFAPLQDLPK
jgi:hypothetical protein